MLKITDKLQSKEILVTKGAYENLYKGLGYTIVGDKKETKVEEKKEVKLPEPEPVVSEPTVEKTEDDDIFEQIRAKKSNKRK